MAREKFIDSLRLASRLLSPPTAFGNGAPMDPNVRLVYALQSADLWLTPKSVEGFDSADFSDRPPAERKKLVNEVAEFLNFAEKAPPDKPAKKSQSDKARKHLENAIAIVRSWLCRNGSLRRRP